MRTIFIALLLLPLTAHAWDGEIWGGAFLSSTRRAAPSGQQTARYVSGMEIGHQIGAVRPYARVETLMDERDGLRFHPASVAYEVGTSIRLVAGLHVDLSHTCWHPVDSAGKVEEWDLIQLRYTFP